MRRHAARQNHSSSTCSAVIVSRPKPRVRRPQHGRVHALEGVPRLPEQWGAGDDVDVDAEPAELVRPGEMPRFAATPHHREAPHEHRYAHR